MSFMYLVLFGLLALQRVSAEGTALEPSLYSSGNINEYVDRLLELVRPQMADYDFDPFHVDKITHDFWFKVLFINYTGYIELKNGWLHDLSTIERVGDATIKYEKKLLTFYVNLIVDRLLANFDYSAKLFNIGPKGTLTANIKKQKIQFGLQIDFERITFHLQKFALANNKEVKIHMTGLGLADIVINAVTNALSAVFRNSISRIIGNQIKMQIEDILAQLPPLLPPPPPEGKGTSEAAEILNFIFSQIANRESIDAAETE